MNTIYVVPICGMCNRFKAISSAWYFAYKNRYEMKTLWKNGWDGLSYTDFAELPNQFQVFQNKETIEIENGIRQTFGDVPKDVLDKALSQNWLPNQNNVFKLRNRNGDVLFRSCMDMFHHQDFKWLSENKDYSWLKFKSGIVQAAERYIKENIGSNDYIGMHIRKTDYKDAVKFSPTILFDEKIKRLIEKDADVKIYLASDDEDDKNYLRNKYGGNVIAREVLKRGQDNFEMDSCMDFIILSRSRFIYKSFSSTFAEEAAYFGKTGFEILKI